MKSRSFILLAFLVLATPLFGQNRALQYIPYALGSGTGPAQIYNPGSDASVDAAFATIESTGFYNGERIYWAVRYGPAGCGQTLANGPSACAPFYGTPYSDTHGYGPLYQVGISVPSESTLFLRSDLSWQATSSGSVATKVTSTSGDTLSFAAGETNWWLENDSATTAHFYLPNPDSATEEGTGVFITTINHALDTVIAVGSIDKNNTMLIFSNGNGGAPGTSTELIAHKGKWYTRNSGVTVQ